MRIRQKTGAWKVFRHGGEHVFPEACILSGIYPDLRKKMIVLRQGKSVVVLSAETLESLATWLQLRTP